MQFADKDDAHDDDTEGHGWTSVCREYAVTRLDPLTCPPHCAVAWKRESAETEWESVNNQTTNNYSFSEN